MVDDKSESYDLAKAYSSAFAQIVEHLAEHFETTRGGMLVAALSAAVDTGVRCAVVLSDAKGMPKDEARAGFLASCGRVFDVAWDSWQSTKAEESSATEE